MYTIAKEFSFEAAHLLRDLPEGHPCTRLHGHSYKVIVELTSDSVDKTGFVKDYRLLARIKEYIDSKFDHQYLNAIVDFNPTAENLAKYFYKRFKPLFPKLNAVTVKETEKTMARYDSLFDTEDKIEV